MNENTDSLVISCADKRYIDFVDTFIQKGFKAGTYYKILIPGSSLAFQTCSDAMNYSLGLFLPIIGSIHIIDHYDCAAYQDAYNIPDTDQWRHIENLRNAVLSVRALNEYIPVYTYLMNPNGEVLNVAFDNS